MNITCTVHGIDSINSKLTRQWSKGPDLICYNGHPIDSNKYTEILTTGNQFKLQVKNVSESDLNCKYQCRYGFEAHAKNIQLSKDKYEYPPDDNMRAVVHTNDSARGLTINLHFKKIFPVPRCRAIFRGSSLSFNITSSTNYGNFYEMNLRHKSTNKLQCDEEIVVKCKLINEYTIPTEDIRKCKIYVWKFVLPCLADRERENKAEKNSSSLKANKYADEGSACLNAEEGILNDVYSTLPVKNSLKQLIRLYHVDTNRFEFEKRSHMVESIEMIMDMADARYIDEYSDSDEDDDSTSDSDEDDDNSESDGLSSDEEETSDNDSGFNSKNDDQVQV
ncbi:unnamed protein product [Mytilus coruscus]|uniref:Ig-like domain-containing protein n=1 Tax=Mytilus coruscus TaxID=42192 RepID=A0A6J8B9F2_MYTCO|nr:unnamed protein product [Mytilus coruscus]